jgi:hypothetical protein
MFIDLFSHLPVGSGVRRPVPAAWRIKSASANFEGKVCAVCGQIAFKIAIVEMNGADAELPLCGLHYIETKTRSPHPGTKTQPL